MCFILKPTSFRISPSLFEHSGKLLNQLTKTWDLLAGRARKAAPVRSSISEEGAVPPVLPAVPRGQWAHCRVHHWHLCLLTPGFAPESYLPMPLCPFDINGCGHASDVRHKVRFPSTRQRFQKGQKYKFRHIFSISPKISLSEMFTLLKYGNTQVHSTI